MKKFSDQQFLDLYRRGLTDREISEKLGLENNYNAGVFSENSHFSVIDNCQIVRFAAFQYLPTLGNEFSSAFVIPANPVKNLKNVKEEGSLLNANIPYRNRVFPSVSYLSQCLWVLLGV